MAADRNTMYGESRRPRGRRWPWVLGLLALAALNLYVQSFGGGVCIDYVDRPGVCYSWSGFGSPGNEILWGFSVAVAVLLLIGLVRVGRRRRSQGPGA